MLCEDRWAARWERNAGSDVRRGSTTTQTDQYNNRCHTESLYISRSITAVVERLLIVHTLPHRTNDTIHVITLQPSVDVIVIEKAEPLLIGGEESRRRKVKRRGAARGEEGRGKRGLEVGRPPVKRVVSGIVPLGWTDARHRRAGIGIWKGAYRHRKRPSEADGPNATHCVIRGFRPHQTASLKFLAHGPNSR